MDELGEFAQAIQSLRIAEASATDVLAGVCCGVKMHADNLEYNCGVCGRVKPVANVGADAASRAGQARGSKDSNEVLFQSTLRTLQTYSRGWTGSSFPDQLLRETANIYVELQKENPGLRKRGKFKSEILAAILFILCQNNRMNHKEENIAQFMKLRHGFSQGYKNVQRIMEQYPLPLLEIDMSQEKTVEGFAARYLDALNIDTTENVKFVCDLVSLSERLMVGMSSRIDSKVIGAIWILQYEMEIGIPAAQLEAAADGTKKSTFMKYVKSILDNEICAAFISKRTVKEASSP